MGTAILTEQPRAASSPLLDKVRRLDLTAPLDLERLAIARGCSYYDRDLPPRAAPLGDVPLSNEELAVALACPAFHPGAREIRLTAALLGSPDLRPDQVAGLAQQESCDGVIRYIAQCGVRYEPQNSFWQNLLDLLPGIDFDPGKLPHPTRFVEMTGIDREKIGIATRWIRPACPPAT